MNSKPKILKVFAEAEVQQDMPHFDWVFSPVKFFENFNKIKSYTPDAFDEEYMANVLEATKQRIEEDEDIKGVFIKLDIESLILSGVLGQCKNHKVKLPTFESVFLCNHKYYQRTMEKDPIKFTYFDVFDENWDKNLIEFPFFLKAPSLQMSIHQYIVRDKEQLTKIVALLREDLPKYETDFMYIAKQYLDFEKYPLAGKYIVLCEELIEDAYQLNWEGWADAEGEVHTYGFTDEVLADPGIFSDFIMPSVFPEQTLKIAEEICFDFLKKVGFTNGFVNAELWVRRDGSVKLIEVNPRIAYSYPPQYKAVYGTDFLDAVIRLSMGQPVKDVPSLQNVKQYSSQSVFATRLNGKISDLLNFEKIEEEQKAHPEYIFVFLFADKNFEIKDNFQNGGRVLMRVFFNKPTYEEIQAESLRLKKAFLVKDTYYLH